MDNVMAETLFKSRFITTILVCVISFDSGNDVADNGFHASPTRNNTPSYDATFQGNWRRGSSEIIFFYQTNMLKWHINHAE